MALTSQFVKLKIGSVVYCIKSFPDIDPHGNPDQIETTDLCEEYHTYVDGLKNYAEDLEFVANYDEAKFNTLNSLSTSQTVDILLCSSASDETGANGKFSITSADVYVKLNGAGVGDVMEMTIVIKPKSDITFATV